MSKRTAKENPRTPQETPNADPQINLDPNSPTSEILALQAQVRELQAKAQLPTQIAKEELLSLQLLKSQAMNAQQNYQLFVAKVYVAYRLSAKDTLDDTTGEIKRTP